MCLTGIGNYWHQVIPGSCKLKRILWLPWEYLIRIYNHWPINGWNVTILLVNTCFSGRGMQIPEFLPEVLMDILLNMRMLLSSGDFLHRLLNTRLVPTAFDQKDFCP